MNKIDLIINNKIQKPITFDIHYDAYKNNLPVILFIHGFKGFKDWGQFNWIAQEFVNQGFVFVKLNTSCNGTTANKLTEFDDLFAFGENTFSKELDDIDCILHFINNRIEYYGGNANQINLIGHSRGGGLAILTAQKNDLVKNLITWASVSNFEYFFNQIDKKKWEEEGIIYTYNARTKQNMPLNYSLYQDYIENKNNLDIPLAASYLNKNWLIIHGENDESVDKKAASDLKNYQTNATLKLIDGANHTFGGKHPYTENELPKATKELIKETINFIHLQSI